MLKVLRLLGEETLGWLEPPRRGEGKSVAEALEACPDLLAIVDATEQRIQRPSDNDQQKVHYSGKKKAHTRKTGIVVNEHGRIRQVTESVPGSRHDLKLIVQSGTIDKIPEDIPLIGDKALDGLQNYYPDRSIGTPHKARRNHPLEPDHKLANRELASIRIVVEHTLSQMKHFRALADVFRHGLERYDDVFRSIVGIINDRIDRRLALASAGAQV